MNKTKIIGYTFNEVINMIKEVINFFNKFEKTITLDKSDYFKFDNDDSLVIYRQIKIKLGKAELLGAYVPLLDDNPIFMNNNGILHIKLSLWVSLMLLYTAKCNPKDLVNELIDYTKIHKDCFKDINRDEEIAGYFIHKRLSKHKHIEYECVSQIYDVVFEYLTSSNVPGGLNINGHINSFIEKDYCKMNYKTMFK